MITNPKAVRFSEQVRSFAGSLGSLFRTADQFMINVVEEFESVTTEAPNEDVIADSAQGIRPITKQNIAEFKFVVEQFLAMANQSDRRAVVSRVATSTQPIF
jgi:hypothetical protein